MPPTQKKKTSNLGSAHVSSLLTPLVYFLEGQGTVLQNTISVLYPATVIMFTEGRHRLIPPLVLYHVSSCDFQGVSQFRMT